MISLERKIAVLQFVIWACSSLSFMVALDPFFAETIAGQAALGWLAAVAGNLTLGVESWGYKQRKGRHSG